MADDKPIEIPSQHWGAFELVRDTFAHWQTNYHLLVQHCLTHSETRQFGEWIADELSPHDWAVGTERGFVRQETDDGRSEDADALDDVNTNA